MKELVMIVAASDNNVIGREGKIPWHNKKDLARFKSMTLGNSCIMGRKTYESLPVRPLPDRENIVLSRNPDYVAEGAIMAKSFEEAVEKARHDQVFICGGSRVYEEGLKYCTRIELTRIHKQIEGDTYLPSLDMNIWREEQRKDHEGFSFITYRKDAR